MITSLLMTCALLSAQAAPDDATPTTGLPRLEVSAHIEGELLAAGDEATLVVELDADLPIHADFDPRLSTPKGMLRKPILQIAVPEGVLLLDPYKPREQWSERRDPLDYYFDRPFGRLLDTRRTEIPVRLMDATGVTALGLNVVTYLDGPEPEDAVLWRRRLELPVRTDAQAVEVPPTRSDWGRHGTMVIGDQAADFALPDGKGGELTLSEWLGRKRPVFAYTYRSSW